MICLEAIVNPIVHAEMYQEGSWSWDADSRVKANGLLVTLKSSNYLMAFLVAKNYLEIVRPIATKLQKREQDVVGAYKMIDQAIKLIHFEVMSTPTFMSGLKRGCRLQQN